MVQDLCTKLLYSKNITQSNSMCSWLGGNNAEAAVRQLAANRVEVTTTENYNEWLRQTWGITTTTQLNRSEAFTSLSAMSPQDVSYVKETYSEDIKLYAAIRQELLKSGKLSLSGEDLQ